MSTLNMLNGSQVQATSVQGISIAKDYCSVSIDFVDPATNQYFDPTTYSVSITKDGQPLTDIKVMKPLSRVDDSRGVWSYNFLMKNSNGDALGAGTYVFTFTGSATGITPVTHVLTFAAAEIPVEQYFVNALRLRLGDKRSRRYLIDSPRNRWSDEELYSFVDDARLDIGQTPPSPQEYSFPFMYSENNGLVILGGFIFALSAMGVFENYNRINYSDELSFQVDRSNFYQNARSLDAQYQQAKVTWKRDKAFHDLRGGKGMNSGRFPLYTTRCLSLQSTMQNTFYG